MYKTWTSPVPALLTALTSLLTQAFSLAGGDVLVKDGPWASAESANQVIAVGWSGFGPGYQFPSRSMSEELGGADVTAEGTQEGLAPSIREHLAVSMASIVRSTENTDMSSARVLAYANIAVVGAAIAPPNHTISKTVLSSTMGSVNALHQVQDRRGAIAIVTFSISCQAYSQQ